MQLVIKYFMSINMAVKRLYIKVRTYYYIILLLFLLIQLLYSLMFLDIYLTNLKMVLDTETSFFVNKIVLN